MLTHIDRARELLKQSALNEKRCFTAYLSKSAAFQTLSNLFKKKVPQLPSPNPLLGNYIDPLKSDEKISDVEIDLFEKQDFKELSQLCKDDLNPVPKEALKAFFGNRKELTNEEFKIALNYLNGFLESKVKKDPFSKEDKAPLNKNPLQNSITQMERAKEVELLIGEMIGKKCDLNEMAKVLTDELFPEGNLLNIDQDNPFLYFGNISVKRTFDSSSLFQSFLNKQLPPEMYQLIYADEGQLTERIRTHFVKILEQKNWITPGLCKKKDKAVEILKGIFKGADKVVNKVLPSCWYQKLSTALKEDLRELAVGQRSQLGKERFTEILWDEMMEKGLQEALESSIQDIFTQSREFINEKLDNVTASVADSLPQTLLDFASTYYDIHIVPQQPFWIEIRKQEDGRFSLYLFSHDPEGHFDSHPIVISDIEPEKLTKELFNDLFLCLLRFQNPLREEGVSYSLLDVSETLETILGKSLEAPNQMKPYLSSESFRENGADYIKRYAHFHGRAEKVDFDLLYSYTLPYQMLCDFWPQVYANPDLLKDGSLRSYLKEMVNQLAAMGQHLYKEKKIEEQELKELTATIREVRKSLADYEKSAVVKSKHSSMIIPDEWQPFVEMLQKDTALNLSNMNELKEVCVAVLGEDVEENIDLLLKEIFRDVKKETQEVHPQDKSWFEVLKLDEVKKFFNMLRTMRASPLHFYRVYAKLSSALSVFLGFSIYAFLLEALIRICIPQINLLLPFSVGHLVKALVLFGPSILAKIVPKELWDVLSSILKFVNETIRYIVRRIFLFVLGIAVRCFLGKQVEAAKGALRNAQERMTKTGELSLELPQKKAQTADNVLKIQLQSFKEEDIKEVKKKVSSVSSTSAELTPDNVVGELEFWRMEFENIAEGGSAFKKIFAPAYLHDKLRLLPIPGTPGAELWDQVKEPLKAIENLIELAARLRQDVQVSSDSFIERTVSIYTIYAIVDKLARRCPEGHLTNEFLSNGIHFGRWVNSVVLKVLDEKTHAKILDLMVYFELDIWADPSLQKCSVEERRKKACLRTCDEQELLAYEKSRLFNFESAKTIFNLKQLNTSVCSTSIQLQNGGMRFSNDFKYYRSLLAKPEIQKKLISYQKSSELEKIALLFGDEDPQKKEEYLLPRPYYYLRQIHLLSGEMSAKDVREYEKKEGPNRSVVLKMNPKKEKKRTLGHGLLDKVAEKGEEIFHKVSLEYFKKHKFKPNLPFAPEPLYEGGKLEWRFVQERRRGEPLSGEPITSFIGLSSGLSQSQLLIEKGEGKGAFRLVSSLHHLQQQEPFLRMLNTYPSDQLVRTLSQFKEKKLLLKNKHMQFAFEWLLTRSFTLESQLKEEKKIVKQIGALFKELHEFFANEGDIEISLYLCRIQSEVVAQSRRYHEKTDQYFPDINGYIEKIEERFRSEKPQDRAYLTFEDGLQICYLYKVASYRYVDIEKMGEKEKRKALLDIARLLYYKAGAFWTSFNGIEFYRASEVLYTWKPLIKELLEKDVDFRAEVIEGVLGDFALDVSKEKRNWEGNYPNYSNGERTIDLEDIPEVKNPSALEEGLRSKVEKEIGSSLTEEKKLSDTHYEYPRENVVVRIVNGKHQVVRTIEGKQYRLLLESEILQMPFALEETSKLWVELSEEEELLIVEIKDGQIVARHFMKSDGDAFSCARSEKKCGEQFLEMVPQKEKSGVLALLNWFQSSSSVNLYRSLEGSSLKRVEFTRLGIAAEVNEAGDNLVGCDGFLPGFHVAPRQDAHKLKNYADSLLWENEQGDQKLLIPAQSFKQLIATFLMKHLGGVATSPFIDSSVRGLLEGIEKQRLFAYSVNEKGVLGTNDAQALFYLVFFHFAHGRFKEALRYFDQLQSIGSQQAFSPELLAMVDQMSVLLLMVRTRQAEEIFLKLAVLREQNASLNKTKQEENSNQTQLDFLRYIAVQKKYFDYLKRTQQGSGKYLNEVQELFLIRSIERISKAQMQKQFPNLFSSGSDGDGMEGILKTIGVDELGGHLLMMPLIAHRHRTLRSQFNEGKLGSRISESIVLNMLFPEDKLGANLDVKSKILSGSTEEKGIILKVLSAYKRTQERFKVSGEKEFNYSECVTQFIGDEGDFEQGKEELTLALLTPQWIARHFLHLYHLAANVLPEDWKGNEEKEMLFQKQKAAFERYFPLLSGKIENPSARLLFGALRMARQYNSLKVRPLELKSSYLSLKKLKAQELDVKDPNELKELMESQQTILHNQLRALFIESHSLANHYIAYELTGLQGAKGPQLLIQGAKKVGRFIVREGVGFVVNKITRLPLFIANLAYKGLTTVNAIVKEEGDKKPVNRQRALLKTQEIKQELREEMEQREEGINTCMQEILDEYFDVKELEDVEDPRHKVEEYANVSDSFNQSIKDFQKRELEPVHQYTFKVNPGEDEIEKKKKFNALLVQLKSEVSTWLKMERSAMARYANHAFKKDKPEDEQCLEFLSNQGEKREPLSFKEIALALTQQKEHLLMTRSQMKQEQLGHLKESFYLYLVLASRWNLLFEQMEKGGSLEDLAKELHRRRSYGFKDLPELLVFANLKFEESSKKMVREKPFEKLKDSLLVKNKETGKYTPTKERYEVVEQLPGSGKTWYMTPLLQFWAGDGENLSVSISPASVAKANMSTISKQTFDVFGQIAHWIQIGQRGQLTEDQAFALCYTIEGALLSGDFLAMTKEQRQSLELMYIELECAQNGLFGKKIEGREIKKIIGYLRRALKLIRAQAIDGNDEVHQGFNRKKELNYPLGKRKCLSNRYTHVMSEVLFYLVNSEELKPYLTVKSKKPSPMPVKEYNDNVCLKLAEILIKKLPLFKDVLSQFKESEKKEVQAYISDATLKTPQCLLKCERLSEINMVRGMVTLNIPTALEKTIHVDFNASKKKDNGEQARPSEGNNNTQEQSSIRSAYEAYVKTGLTLLHDRLTNEQIDKLIDHMRERAIERSQATLCKKEETLEARLFKEFCQKEEKKECLGALFSFTKEQKEKIYKRLRKSDRATLAYLKYVISKEIHYFEWNLSNNSYNYGTQGKQGIGGTGTYIDMGRYLHGTQLIADPGTNGESVEIMERKGVKENAVVLLEHEEPKEVLNELVGRFFTKDQPMNRVIADRGAYFNGLQDKEVAEILQEKVVNQEGREDLKGTDFYVDEGHMVLEKGAKKETSMESTQVNPEECFGYYSQARTYALDIKRHPNAVCFVTIGEDITFTELAQAIWRMRGLKTMNQDLVFVLTKRVRDKIMGGREGMPTVRDIIAFARHNEESAIKEDNYEGDRQQLHNVVRRRLLDKALFAKKDRVATEILRDYHEIFVTKTQTDPNLLYGAPLVDEDPKKVFVALRKKYIELVEKCKYLKDEVEEIKKEINQIGNGIYPEKVSVYKRNDQIGSSPMDDMNKQVQVQANRDEDVEIDVDVDVELDIQRHQNQENLDVKKQMRPQTFFPWPEKFNPNTLEWLKVCDVPKEGVVVSKALKKGLNVFKQFATKNFDMHTVPIYQMSKVLGSLGSKEGGIGAKHLSKFLLATNNMMYLDAPNSCPIEPFSHYQVPVFEVLLVKRKKDSVPLILLLDQQEAQFWRKKLKEDRTKNWDRASGVKLGLYDLDLGFVSQGFNRFKKGADGLENKEFKSALVQLKFLFGRKEYSAAELELLEEWLKKDLSLIGLNDKWKGSKAERMIRRLLGKEDKEGVQELF